MHTIHKSLEIDAPLATLRAAIGTEGGFRAWFCEDTRVDAAGRYTFSFGVRQVTLAMSHADERRVVMTCVGDVNNPEWRGTELTIALTPTASGATRVDLAHAGYPNDGEVYTRCVGAWTYFLGSLAQYATTGKGTPFARAAAAESAAVAS